MTEKVIIISPLKNMIPIIKIVGDFCNLHCGYCFYNARDQSTPHIMSDDLLEKFIYEYLNIHIGNLKFIWHGGEPLLAGIPFFQRILDFQKKYAKANQKIQNNIQTNGTLIDDHWAGFFRKHDFKIGISLDGDKESHDRFRKNRGDKGTFDLVMRGIENLSKYNIQPGFIQTVTHDNVIRAKKNFEFFANTLDVKSFGINFFLDLAATNETIKSQSITNQDMVVFLKTYIDLWLEKNDRQLKVREIENFMAGVFGKMAPGCAFNGTCANFFCLDYDGKIYPCDRLSNKPEFLFGDLSQQPLLRILNSSVRLKYAENVNSLHPDCVVCEWKNACHNGCTANRMGNRRKKYYYCEARKTIFSYLQEKIKS